MRQFDSYNYCHRNPAEEKPSYKDFSKVYIGASDGATLNLIGGDENLCPTTYELCFGEDGDYLAYLVRGICDIGSHYVLEAEFYSYMVVLGNDPQLSALFGTGAGGRIRVYRAGEFGCIIQLLPLQDEQGTTA